MEAGGQLLRYTEVPNLQDRRDALLARRVCLLADLTEVDRGLNATVPVHQLPDEVVIEILAYLVVHGHGEATRPWRRLMEVCHRWRVIVCSTALFWRQVSVGRNLTWLMLCLERCGNAPLVDISFHEAAFPHHVLPPILASHASAIRSLAFPKVNWQWETSLTALFTLHMPALEQVAIENVNMGRLCTGLQVSGTQVPGLRSFSLSGFAVPDHLALCQKLRRIDFRNAPLPMGLRKFFADMQDKTQLQEILISDSYDEVPAMLQIPVPTAPPLDLPRVRKFHLNSGARPVIQHILYELRTHNATDISITGVVRAPQDVPGNDLFCTRLLPGPRRPLDVIPAFPAAVTSVVLRLQGRGPVVLEASSEKQRIHLAIADQSTWLLNYEHLLHICLTDVIALFSSAPVTSITVLSDRQYPTRCELWRILFSSFPQLETLTLTGLSVYSNMWDGLMEASTTRTAPEMACHRLKTIELDDVRLERNYDSLFSPISAALRYRAMHGCRLEMLRMRIKLYGLEDDLALRRTYFPALCTSVDTIVYHSY
ncbi:hypothetical protein L226DRAFT_538845 [Lentinus tigrinus ALCF2SS1-7]|uniref:F-box domain-containing protein n=1 Tax=Lentinus tigrinus ALCF2SS1-6 TaxID=1328759 RepID=A0A5C2RUP8_9APHY|nr:hypothetical protein L227DRAFT_657930 [Lentinus tigrinus ALCF2SS1-6]RPD70600.1 hypothetical protein L226DRAFT_538845 [Lentinus tigrinus ALCF2SS1-7]